MSIEEPKFTVELKNQTYEIRKYESILIAEVNVESDFEAAGNQGFKILADYIFGNNTSNEKISMGAPVVQEKSEKIEMTAPVNLSKSKAGYAIQFTMPAKFNSPFQIWFLRRNEIWLEIQQ